MCRTSAYLIICALVGSVFLTGAAKAVDPDLVGWWRLDEGSGTTAADSSGNGNDGALQNGPGWVSGKMGGALEFDGADDQVDCGNDSSLDITGPITIAAWVYPTGRGNSDFPRIVDKSNGTGGADPGYKLYLRSAENYLLTLSAGGVYLNSSSSADLNAWNYVVFITDGTQRKLFLNGAWEVWDESSLPASSGNPLFIGNSPAGDRHFEGRLDDVRVYSRALTEEEIQNIMLGEGWPYAGNPNPADGAVHEDTWVNLSWSAGDPAVSHDVYLGENFEDVNIGTESTFRGNQTATSLVIGFPGFPYPDGLVPGTTYYWRIDEVNEAEPNSPWKGDVWSFSIPPNTAYAPVPADDAEAVALDVTLSWAPGFGAKLHTVYFGDDFDTVSNASGGPLLSDTTFTPPGPFELAKTYYWRVDEFNPPFTYKGEVWSFRTEGTAANPNPAKGAVDVSPTPILTWTAGNLAASHEVYFGADAGAVANATTASPEHKGTKALGEESYETGKLDLLTTYYWRIDEVNSTQAGSPWIGNVWTFTTGDFLVVDDFEAYNDIDPPDETSNRIFESWIDGFGTTDNGALVGNDLPPYAEQTIVHGGNQSMPYFYDNNLKTSEATLTLVYPRDWTAEGVTNLSLWFRGASANAADRIYVALNGAAVVYNDDPAATQDAGWNQWVIDLTAFTGVNLTNVSTITIGIGTKGSPAAGGTGTMYFDDIRLIR